MSQTVVITGSTSGIGLAAARNCLAQGARVVISSENSGALCKTLSSLSAYDGQVIGQVCDVSRLEEVEALLDCALREFGELHCWVNNAGTTAPSGDSARVPLHFGKQLIATNVLGCYHGSVLALRHFRDKGRGRLINITGRGERGPVAGAGLYGSSKAWLRNFTLVLAKEESRHGIEVGTFNPGLTLTQLTRQPQVLRGNEQAQLKGLRMIMPLIGGSADEAGESLAAYALGLRQIKPENRHRRLLPLLLKRLATGSRAPMDVNEIQANIVEPE